MWLEIAYGNDSKLFYCCKDIYHPYHDLGQIDVIV